MTTDGDHLTRLIRLLIVHAGQATTGRRESEGDDVMLDIEVEGVRCLLISVRPTEPDLQAHSSLTAREEEIAHMVAKGYPDKTIAAILGISRQTVSTHLRRIFLKLDVHTRAMAARVVEEDMTV